MAFRMGDIGLIADGTGVQTSAAFNASTKFIRVICEVQCAIAGTGTATATDTLLERSMR
jgi:hypothetical protein